MATRVADLGEEVDEKIVRFTGLDSILSPSALI
jgi:hypothetical protein